MTPIPNGLSIGDYQERLSRYKDAENEKNAMISELIENLDEARSEYRQTTLDLESERVGRRRLQDRVAELETLTRSQNGRGFVVVLIDADADDYIFQQRFLNRNEAGGRDAADELQARVKDYLRTIQIDVENTDIVVRAYADVKSLHGACIKNGKMKSGASLSLFVHGFNQRQGLFDFVDVGPGKESADNKLRECLDFFIGNWQCKHIIFGACHDSGYAPYLGRFAAEVSVRDRITLLQGVAVHPRIAALGFRRILKLDQVFNPYMLSTVPVSSSKSSPPARATSSTLPTRPLKAATGFSNAAALSHRLGPVIRNENRKRIDKMLDVDITSPYLGIVRQTKLCPWFYLRGRCEGCDGNHRVPPLNARESDYLWYHARYGLCHKIRKGKDCDDPRCVYGHEEGNRIGSGKVSG
ncbi:hypothetical protein HO133_006253 [Letharia lupina]|uniref:DUF7923 domain-containing protein n=1 Tax=Letharia lupina TaxID=560253 RepID=A0A8H6C740_9LECA|nr:uncharacterized protein HO133_006253 [Letharia lupina]KAF6217841.1 hypothetical protein HO133_006253 [Letharia lupina]